MQIIKVGTMWKGQSGIVYSEKGICPTLYAKGTGKTGGNAPIVLVSPKSTSTQSKFTKDTSQNIKTMETLPKSTPVNYQLLTSLLEDSHVRLFPSQENEKALTIPEGRSSLKLLEYCEISNQDCSSLKTLKDCLVTTTEELSRPSSPRLMNWGMTSNGKCLTARISESPRIGKECSLSDILEEQVDPKYFLSQSQTEKILSNSIAQSTATIESTELGGVSLTLNTMQGGNRQPFIQNPKMQDYRKNYENVGAITATSYKEPPVVNAIRRLTPTECERLQGFPDGWTRLGAIYGDGVGASVEISDTQRYKTLGNAVTVNVIREIIKRMI